jgi:hypothetical protein
MHPLITSKVAAARHQEMLAQAAQQRLARQAIAQARALRRARRSERQVPRAARLVLRPRASTEQ